MTELPIGSWVGTYLDPGRVRIESERPLVPVHPLFCVAALSHESLAVSGTTQGLEVQAFMKYFCSFYSGMGHFHLNRIYSQVPCKNIAFKHLPRVRKCPGRVCPLAYLRFHRESWPTWNPTGSYRAYYLV